MTSFEVFIVVHQPSQSSRKITQTGAWLLKKIQRKVFPPIIILIKFTVSSSHEDSVFFWLYPFKSYKLNFHLFSPD